MTIIECSNGATTNNKTYEIERREHPRVNFVESNEHDGTRREEMNYNFLGSSATTTLVCTRFLQHLHQSATLYFSSPCVSHHFSPPLYRFSTIISTIHIQHSHDIHAQQNSCFTRLFSRRSRHGGTGYSRLFAGGKDMPAESWRARRFIMAISDRGR